MLNALGVWESLAPDAQPIREILVTDGKAGQARLTLLSAFRRRGSRRRQSRPYRGKPSHPRRAVSGQVEAAANLELMAPAAVKSLTVEAGGAIARLANGEEISACLVIAADGRESPLRSQMGVQIIGWSYPQTGIVATVEHERPHNGVAYEHFPAIRSFRHFAHDRQPFLAWYGRKAIPRRPGCWLWTRRASMPNWRAALARIWV
jgi:2-octaprenyl-6-methoxyphenol hydroxylase